jgi:ubiquinone/menaquinone biosynthesis C-methylase UbiE
MNSDSMKTSYGHQILMEMRESPQLTKWTFELVQKYIKKSVLEIGSGIGNNVSQLLTYSDEVIATDIDEKYLSIMKEKFKEFSVKIYKFDVTKTFDKDVKVETVFCSNVLEHIADEEAALKNIKSLLKEEGSLILIVPQGAGLFSSIDKSLDHLRRYDEQDLRTLLTQCGYQIQHLFSYNKIAVLGWYWQGKIRKTQTLGKKNMKLYNLLVPIFKLLDPYLPWNGLSWCVIAKTSCRFSNEKSDLNSTNSTHTSDR